MILELDIGNSRIKWRAFDPKKGTASKKGEVAGLQDLETNLLGFRPEAVRFCSVRDKTFAGSICKWSERAWGIEPQEAVVERSCAGVTNHYEDLSRLGIDRWLAMVAAYQLANGSSVIVDGGTALTLDILAKDGQHQGGYILPGLELMATSLEANTGIHLSEELYIASPAPGHSTEEAVINGNLAALLSLVKEVLQSVSEQNPGVKLFLSGGDAELLDQHILFDNKEVVSSLVLDGLAIVCPINAEGDE